MVQALSTATRGGNSSSNFRSHKKVSRAEKLPLFPGYYFLMMPNISPVPRGATFQHLNRCPGYPLLDHAALCRRVAGEISHTHAAKTLRMMAREYESRALEGLARSRGERRRESGNVQN